MKKSPSSFTEVVVSRCPKCDGVGRAYHVKTYIGSVQLHMRCRQCAAEWNVMKPGGTPAGATAGDRSRLK